MQCGGFENVTDIPILYYGFSNVADIVLSHISIALLHLKRKLLLRVYMA